MTPYIYTRSGQPINPLDPAPSQIRIQDIAHHLALCNRFAGATLEPISVAQHSVYASYLCDEVDPRVSLQALLHDASEAYMGDVTKWLKGSPEMVAYRVAEARVQATIYRLFGCDLEDAPKVRAADKLLVRYEMMQGFSDHRYCQVGQLNPAACKDYPPLTAEEIARMYCAYPGEPWSFWPWQKAKRIFLERFEELTRGTE